MKTAARIGTALLVVAITAVPVARAQNAGPERSAAPERPWESVDLAIAIDVSGSMGPLIESARLKIWEIVHDITLMEPTPSLRVALISYGSKTNDWRKGWVRVEAGLTADLDVVSQRLFGLEAGGGGGEYLGRVLKIAVEDLDWTRSSEALKLLFIAGNERADQDPEVSFLEMAEEARRNEIIVNAIFCGEDGHSHTRLWKDLVAASEGSFGTINHRKGTVVVHTPFDDELAELGKAINDTFLPMGADGAARLEALEVQDRQAASVSPATVADRAEVKASPLYSAGWDLIDAVAAGRVDLDHVQEEQLPDRLRGLTPEERAETFERLRFRREDLRQRIFDLGEQREQHVASHMQSEGIDDSLAFDTAVRRVLQERLEERGFRPRNR